MNKMVHFFVYSILKDILSDNKDFQEIKENIFSQFDIDSDWNKALEFADNLVNQGQSPLVSIAVSHILTKQPNELFLPYNTFSITEENFPTREDSIENLDNLELNFVTSIKTLGSIMISSC